MSIKSAQNVTVCFVTSNATTGAAADADSTPTGTLYVNGTADAATVTVTKITTGVYKAALTLPTLTAGDIVSLRIAATVATIAGEGVAWQDVADTKRVSDLNDIAAGAAMTLADDAITSAKFDESTAFPLKFADTGTTAIARTGADSDTLETLSDQMDDILDDTDDIGVAGAGLTALGDTRLANLDATVSSRSSLAAADVRTAVGLATANLDTQLAALPTAAENADAVLDEALSGHTTTGTFGAWANGLVAAITAALIASTTYLAAVAAAVWAYATRVLTSTAASTTATVTGSAISIQRGDTTSISLTGLGNISARTKLWFTIKNSVTDHDAYSKLMVRETTGLIYVNGLTPSEAGLTTADASVTVTNATTGALTIALSASLTAMLTPDTGLVYDIQMLTASGVTTLTSSTAAVVGDVTHATS